MNPRVIFLSLAIWVLTGLPVLTGYLNAGSDRYYVGRINIVAADTTAYYSDIEQARQGRFLFANQFTSEPQAPSLFHPLWLVSGWIGALGHMATPLAYQLVRLLATWLFVWLLDRVVRSMWTDPRAQWIALLTVLTSSGLGWLLTFSAPDQILLISVDLWVAESNTLASIGHSALFIGSQAMLMLWIWTFWRWTTAELRRLPWWLHLTTAGILIMHPYDIITLAMVILGWSIWKYFTTGWHRHELKQLAGFASLQLFLALLILTYYQLVVLKQEAMTGWLAQNIDHTPNLLKVLIGYGLLVPFAIVGALRKWKLQPITKILVVWAVAELLVMYFPITFQRRLISGLHIPIALLASQAIIQYWRTGITPVLRNWLLLGLLVVCAMTNLKSVLNDVGIQLVPQSVDYPVYISREEHAAMQVLKTKTDFDDVIFSEVWVGNAIPGVIGRTVVVGHGHQTLDLQGRLRDWEAFTNNKLTPAERTAMLQRLRVTWLYWRTIDQKPDGYRPAQDAQWQLRYQNPDVQLFELQPQAS